jgi:hypothetical protein
MHPSLVLVQLLVFLVFLVVIAVNRSTTAKHEMFLNSVYTSTGGYRKSFMSTKLNSRPARYVRLMALPPINEYFKCMNIRAVKVFNAEGNNVSSMKPVTMSSTSLAVGYSGGNLTDLDDANEAHTLCTERGWMIIDLESMMSISKVIVYNRKDCCQDRLIGTVVQLLDENRNVVYTSSPLSSADEQEVII